MNISLYIFFGVIGLFLFVFIGWRLLSYRYVLPCPTWLAWMVEMDNPFTKVNRAATIIEHLNLQPGMRVLDVGCGPGRLTIPVARNVGPEGHVVAMDIQEGMLDRVKEKARAANLNNITYLHAGVGQGKLEKNTYDRALLICVLGEIPNQQAALQEIFDALKPGGILSVTEIIFDPHFQRKSTVLAVSQSVGFEEKRTFGRAWAYTMHLKKPA